MQLAHTLHASRHRRDRSSRRQTSPPIVAVTVVVVVFEWRREHVVSRAVIGGRDNLRPSPHYSLDPGNHSHRRIVLERVSHCVIHVSIRTVKNHAQFYSFFFVVGLHRMSLRGQMRTLSFSGGSQKSRGGSTLDIDVTIGREFFDRFALETNFLTRSKFNCHLLKEIHGRFEGARIRSSRAMDGARASSSAMSLDAADELSRTDKRTPTYSHPCYLSPGRSGRYPSRAAYTCRLTLPCADTRASCKLDNLRASSRASIGRRRCTL